MVLLSDIAEMKFVSENSAEPLVSLRGVHDRVVVDESRSQIASRSEYFCYARQSVRELLARAADRLPPGYCFILKEAYRPLSRQRRSYEEAYAKYRALHAGLSDRELRDKVATYVAPVSVAGHPTGGAIDVTLGSGGRELDMGTRFNDEAEETGDRTYLHAANIGEEAKAKRAILKDALSVVGFVNYPPEWWHWSYGDAYWAYCTKSGVKYEAIDDAAIDRHPGRKGEA